MIWSTFDMSYLSKRITVNLQFRLKKINTSEYHFCTYKSNNFGNSYRNTTNNLKLQWHLFCLNRHESKFDYSRNHLSPKDHDKKSLLRLISERFALLTLELR